MGLIHFVKKLLFCKNGLYFWLGPIYKLFKSHVNYALTWILRIIGPIKFCIGPLEISNGPLKFGNLHVFEWDIGHYTILFRAQNHFGLGLSLSGAGNVCFLRRSCTSGYKHETFRLCSSNLSCKYFLVSHRKFVHFQDG